MSKGKITMKTTSEPKKIQSRPSPSGLRLVAASILVLAAVALAAKSMQPPKLPWAAPTAILPGGGEGVAFDASTNTLYVTNIINLGVDVISGVVSVIDNSKCNASIGSDCTPVATMSSGSTGPFWIAFDSSTGTLYVASELTADYNNDNTLTILNTQTCNAKNTSGCGQAPVATLHTPGFLGNIDSDPSVSGLITLDQSTHTLYIGDAYDGPVSMLNTATCNATNTTDCSFMLTKANGDAIAIDRSTHSAYVTGAFAGGNSVFNEATCNSITQSNCTATSPVAALPAGYLPFQIGAVDPVTHTFYMTVNPPPYHRVLGYVALIDSSTCNATVHSGCGGSPQLAHVGSLPGNVIIDTTTQTAYVSNIDSDQASVLSTATCNSTIQSGCAQKSPALATGEGLWGNLVLDTTTKTLYASSQDSNSFWALDASSCNAKNTGGCTKFAPTTPTGFGTLGVAANPNTKTIYVANFRDNTVSVVNGAVCNGDNIAGCNQSWPTIAVGNSPQFVGINKATNTIYVSNLLDGTLSLINAATCTGSVHSGCAQLATTTVGNRPLQLVVDEATNTIYVENRKDGTVSVVSGAHCNSADTSGCNPVGGWPVAVVGNSPQGLGFNPVNRTLYVTNTGDNTVSVINGNVCNGTNTSGCVAVATVPVGNGPRSVGIVTATNTVFVGNRDDLTVSLIDGATCNGANTSGCGQTPPAILVGAFPNALFNGANILGRNIAVDQKKQIVFIPVAGDSDVARLDGQTCRAGHVDACTVTIVPQRMGAFTVTAAIDDSSGTVYVGNDNDSTVSLFRSQ